MEILTREELETYKERWEKQGIISLVFYDKVLSTALALMDERDKMKADINKLREKWKHNIGVVERDLKWQLENGTNNLTEKNIEITKNELKVLREWVADLASIGKGE